MQLCTAVGVRMLHDVFLLVRSRSAKGPLLMDLSRPDEMILLADALLMVPTVLLTDVVSHLSSNDAAVLGVMSAYVGMLVGDFPGDER